MTCALTLVLLVEMLVSCVFASQGVSARVRMKLGADAGFGVYPVGQREFVGRAFVGGLEDDWLVLFCHGEACLDFRSRYRGVRSMWKAPSLVQSRAIGFAEVDCVADALLCRANGEVFV